VRCIAQVKTVQRSPVTRFSLHVGARAGFRRPHCASQRGKTSIIMHGLAMVQVLPFGQATLHARVPSSRAPCQCLCTAT
jgi:hypothetical protein